VRDAIASAEHETQCCNGFLINICLSYGARQEIVSACKAVAQAVASGSIAADSVGKCHRSSITCVSSSVVLYIDCLLHACCNPCLCAVACLAGALPAVLNRAMQSALRLN
jgi:undecaprenyl diphosphate synthase